MGKLDSLFTFKAVICISSIINLLQGFLLSDFLLSGFLHSDFFPFRFSPFRFSLFRYERVKLYLLFHMAHVMTCESLFYTLKQLKHLLGLRKQHWKHGFGPILTWLNCDFFNSSICVLVSCSQKSF